MIGDDVTEHKKYKRARTIAGALLLIFAILAGGFGIYANQQKKEAVIALQEADRQRLIAQHQTSIAEAKTLEAERQAEGGSKRPLDISVRHSCFWIDE